MNGTGGDQGGRFTGGLVVLSGPSGSGKTTLLERLESDPRIDVAVTATTRPMRPGEKDGVDYHFLSREEFERRIRLGEFVEYNEVFRNGHLYGSLRRPLEEALARRDRYYVMEIDIEGGVRLLEQGFAGIYLFIAPPSLEELLRRIETRGTETPEAIKQRIDKTRIEMTLKDRYDHVVVNDDLERAYQQVRRILGLTDQPTDPAGDKTR